MSFSPVRVRNYAIFHDFARNYEDMHSEANYPPVYQEEYMRDVLRYYGRCTGVGTKNDIVRGSIRERDFIIIREYVVEE